jgi:3-dehydroquinate dehydratase-2
MKTALVLNGPNLNLLGTREPAVYGSQTLADVEALCAKACAARLMDGIDQNAFMVALAKVQLEAVGRAQAAGTLAGVVLNAGAYTHTSVALHDAIKGAGVTLIELHISNVHAREAFRHHSYISPAAKAVMAGFGVKGYALAIAGLAELAG